jgi:hypothetical protein
LQSKAKPVSGSIRTSQNPLPRRRAQQPEVTGVTHSQQ